MKKFILCTLVTLGSISQAHALKTPAGMFLLGKCGFPAIEAPSVSALSESPLPLSAVCLGKVTPGLGEQETQAVQFQFSDGSVQLFQVLHTFKLADVGAAAHPRSVLALRDSAGDEATLQINMKDDGAEPEIIGKLHNQTFRIPALLSLAPGVFSDQDLH